jgi:sugar/nucleoside kinase (ribokinase family)
MSQAPLDVLGIGNAIVDVIANAPDALLQELGICEDSIQLIDEAQAEALYAKMGPAREVSGGSVGNSMAGLAMLGGRAGYIGKVRDDQLGKVFTHDIRAAGVEFTASAATHGPATACCLILVPPSAKRAMNTYLGCAPNLDPEDLDTKQIARAKITFIEGYAWTSPRMQATAQAAVLAAHRFGNQVALSLSADWIAGNAEYQLLDFVRNHVDILFANEAEIIALTQKPDFASALEHMKGACALSIFTRSEKGAVVLEGEQVVHIPAIPAGQVVDTTGAGDLFAAGFLWGYTQGHDLASAGRAGALCAGAVINQIGARPTRDLKALVAQASAALQY